MRTHTTSGYAAHALGVHILVLCTYSQILAPRLADRTRLTVIMLASPDMEIHHHKALFHQEKGSAYYVGSHCACGTSISHVSSQAHWPT